MPESRQYELVYVVAPDVGEDAVNALHTEVDEIVTGAGGRIEKTDNWGRRRLAYEIGKHREGTYVVELIEGPGEVVHELNRKLKVRDNVLRHLVVRVDEDLKKAQRAREHRQSRQQRRRAARGLAPVPAPPPPPEATPEPAPTDAVAAAGAAEAPAAEEPKAADTGEAEVKE